MAPEPVAVAAPAADAPRHVAETAPADAAPPSAAGAVTVPATTSAASTSATAAATASADEETNGGIVVVGEPRGRHADLLASLAAPLRELLFPRPPDDPAPAALVPDRGPHAYAKSRKVGEGTYANVYEARMLRTGLKVALKKIKVSKLRADGLDVSAVREVKFLRELEHPNIVRLHDVYAHKGNVHLVLEFLPTDLEAVIKNSALTFGPGDVKSWLMMALRGLHHCHRQLILHRDLKPNNLLLGRDGQLKLADFGLARDYGDPARALSSQVVTRWYRSPELLLGAQHYGPGVDIWAMGCIFAELLLRVPYLAGDTDIGQLHTIFRALGTPGAADWPGIELLPDYHALPQYPRTPMRTLFTAAGSETLDLLERMLVFYPPARISALAALGHRYFKMMPPPTPPAQLPGVVPASPLVAGATAAADAAATGKPAPPLKRPHPTGEAGVGGRPPTKQVKLNATKANPAADETVDAKPVARRLSFT